MKTLAKIVVFLLALGVVGVIAIALLTPWMDRWGATGAEINAAFPGDELLPEPASVVNRAVTIQAPPAAIYPWIVQLGAEKGGMYSYDWLETYLLRCAQKNASIIHPEWQSLQVGDLMKMCPGNWGPVPYTVAQVLPDHAVILGHQEGGRWVDLWQFVILPKEDGSSRLVLRTTTNMTGGIWTILHPGIFIMERRMLLGIKERAEALPEDWALVNSGTATPEPPTPTPEIFIARTRAVPEQKTVDLPAP